MTQPCPCSSRTVEDELGRVVWRATDAAEWCGNDGEPWQSLDGQRHEGGWCEACIVKVCRWCRYD